VRGTAATRLTARARQGFIHDLADCARATPALGATAEATVNLTCGARRGRIHGASHLMVTQHVAGTNNHRRTLLRPFIAAECGLSLPASVWQVKTKRSLKKFQTIGL
jgi:hypothetical protein